MKLCKFTFNEPLSLHTSMKVGGPAKIFARPQSIDSLICCYKQLPHSKILGKGTNVIAPDEGVEAVITTLDLKRIYLLEDGKVVCEAGTLLNSLCKFACQYGLSGLEFAYGIPGTVGGAVYMNAGAFGGEIGQLVDFVEVFDGEKVLTLQRDELEFSYRKSIFQKTNWLILKVGFRLKFDDPKQIAKRMGEIYKKRLQTQPLDLPSAGSVFKRPKPDFYVGKAVESLGLKGLRIGGAEISKKHAGFIVNVGNASANDVKALINFIRQKVKEAYNVDLEPEVEIW
ncbi:UDP-N-acetylmuramate dehydrogenase [Pseudothermotoga thermarum]|uniref:UDP-N-acetylenolpyruvoylglucosamine reductase n=1 Tax=Pseudothermotoga thermarum DSM 5069 TaxID=688269 RepID=F7YVF7_9THEM|nr:UDP-N-acetylmuramate dehydrogenase [Pseudothermotoga thermarum]AEH50463.1 UDP-N-acetylmuramate dehydrogenase [Pseudothermotoga thermarum DSM 5069]